MREQVNLEHLVHDMERRFTDTWADFSVYANGMTSGYTDEYYEESLVDGIEGIFVQLSFAYEMLGLTTLLTELRSGFDAHRDSLSGVGVSALGSPSSPTLEFLGTYFRPIRASVAGREQAESTAALQQLERILLGTPKIIKDRGLEPQKEKDVKAAMYQLLVHPYSDVVREVPIAKQSKVYKPDIGIPSLKAAIEYKFADSEEELKKALGGIYEDVSGYAGSADWTAFFAVLYQTDSFLTQPQIEAEFRMSKIGTSWKPLLVVGRGGRKGKAIGA